LRHIFQIDFI